MMKPQHDIAMVIRQDLACMHALFFILCYRLGTVNSKSFVSKVLLRIKWKFELTVHFKHGMLGK